MEELVTQPVSRAAGIRRRWRRATSRVARPALAVVVLLASAGCGGGSGAAEGDVGAEGAEGGARANARATVETWLTACSEENGRVVNELLPELSRATVFSADNVPTGCERIADLVPGPDPNPEELRKVFEEAEVEELQIDAGFGTATVRSPRSVTSELELELSRGVWTVSNPPLRPR